MKKIGKIILLILIIVVIVGGKRYIDKKTFDYHDIVDKSLVGFYTKGSTNELKPIIELMNDYESDEKIRTEIQNYCFEVVGRWYMYLDNKYLCDNNNLNSCRVQVSEFKALDAKLKTLYTVKSKKNYTIIPATGYNNLVSEGSKKVEALEKTISNPNTKNPYDSEQIRKQKCAVAIDCENCKDGLCVCYYVGTDKTREQLVCQNKNTQ